ncbi:MAG: hypothetical protein A4E65_00109 [Syntrophorhabdus sp. PtaU1.Bin153]|nr:MAG: hypothetical protein A4E65_00109 [Syntrophorhabdus sp. PtaU1.Bin153]
MAADETQHFQRLFPQSQIPVVLASVFQAAETLSKNSHEDREDSLTRRLHARLVKIHPFRDGPLSVHFKPKIPGDDVDADTSGGEIDLLVSSDRGYEVYFAFEAKRLRFQSSGRLVLGNDQYVKNGMMRFVSGQYAPLMEAGGMIGYVFDGNKEQARLDVDRYVTNHAGELQLRPPHQLVPSSMLGHIAIDETGHDLEIRPFIIYHLFVPV